MLAGTHIEIWGILFKAAIANRVKIALDLEKCSRHAEANPRQAICRLSNLES